MFRTLCLLCCAVLLVLLSTDATWAQANSWPEFPLDPNDAHALPRGSGGYFSWIKIGIVIAFYFLWTRTTDWVNRDCQILNLPYSTWNLVTTIPFLVGFLALMVIPLFAAGFGVMFLSWAAPLVVYVIQRNGTVEPHERVMTPSHIRYMLAMQLQKMGIDMGEESKEAHEKGAPVIFMAKGGDTKQNQANIIRARQSPAYIAAKELVAELVRQRADKCMLDYTRDAVQIRFQIDGVWHESEGQDRETGDAVLAVFKTMANLNVEERRKRQVGPFVAEFEGHIYNSQILSQGTQTGERAIIQLERPHSAFKTLRELGMREKMEEQLHEIFKTDHGMIIFSSPPSGGLSTTLRLALGLTDRYTRDFVAFQAEGSEEALVDNIDPTTYGPDEVPLKALESLLRREPDVVVVNELPDADCAQFLSDQAATSKLVITTIRAKEGVEALLRVLLMKVPAAKFAPAALAVVNQRLIRKLCEECKQGYEPAPQLLQKLGIPPGRIEQLFRPPDPAEQDKVCQRCNGIGYFGRTSIYELVRVDDKMREALEKQPKLEILRKVSRQAGNRNLQQEGIVLVAQGITSVQELSRVLKQ